MATAGAQRGRGRDWSGALALAAAAGYLAWRAWAFRDADLNPDETVFITQAWAVARGLRLYAESLCQHMPMVIILAHPLAALGWVGDPIPYRALVLLAQLAAGLALALSPLFGRERWKGCLVGALYLALYGAVAPGIQGLAYSGYAVAGAALVVSLASLALPLAAGPAPAAAWTCLGGAAYSMWALSSPALGIPALCFAAACALSPRMDRRAWAWAAAGGLGVAAGQALWLWKFGSLVQWWRQVVVFNATVYPSLNLEPGPGGLWGSALSGAWQDLGMPGLPLLCVLGLPLALAAAPSPDGPAWRRRLVLLSLVAFFLSLHVRMTAWKGLPYWCVAFAGLPLALAWLPARRWGAPAALALTGALALTLVHFLEHQKGAQARAYWHHGDALAMEQAFDRIRPALPPGSTLLALPNVAHYYMLARMPSAGGRVGYGPIAYYMEYQWATPVSPTLCDQAGAGLPALIYDYRGATMYHVPMTDCAPPCLAAMERDHFVALKGWPDWWVRRDLAKLLPRPLGPPPG